MKEFTIVRNADYFYGQTFKSGYIIYHEKIDSDGNLQYSKLITHKVFKNIHAAATYAKNEYSNLTVYRNGKAYIS